MKWRKHGVGSNVEENNGKYGVGGDGGASVAGAKASA